MCLASPVIAEVAEAEAVPPLADMRVVLHTEHRIGSSMTQLLSQQRVLLNPLKDSPNHQSLQAHKVRKRLWVVLRCRCRR